MASIIPKVKSGRIVSYKFKTCVGRNEQGKQVFRCMTWYPQKDMNTFQADKAAQKAALEWEDTVKAEYEGRVFTRVTVLSSSPPTLLPDQRQDDFNSFVSDVWLPLYVRSGNLKPSTISFYQYMTATITNYFKGIAIQDIAPLDIQKYLVYLRTKHKSKLGKPLSSQSLRHQYTILNLIFSFAERQEVIAKNPMNKVDAPKNPKKPVDALSTEQADYFFQALKSCPLDLHCILQLLITTGIRRGECMGLQWKDIDEQASTIRIERNVIYIPNEGITVNAPKTFNSIRTLPILQSTLNLLLELKTKVQEEHPEVDLAGAYLFSKRTDIFKPRDPCAISKRVKRFMINNGLPDLSAHGLRHSCASLLLAHGADIKSVQDILGHADARTTLNFYVRSADVKQMRAATDRLAVAFKI